MPFRLPARALVVLALCLGCRSAPPDDTIAPNDNQRPAGTRKGNVLTVHLEARTGHWQPDGTGGVVIDSIGAFGEVGGPLSTPGPLIRVPVGTNVRGTVRNALGHAVTVYGLGKARGASDSTVLAAGASAPFEFTAATPGTYFYHATRGIDPLTGSRPPEEMQLHGAIIVDAPNAPPDRILAMSWHYVVDTTMPTGVRKPTMTINGLSWPHTEHLTYAQGDSIRWRVINFTEFEHPMHLHGFYFRVTSQSDEAVDTLYTNEQQRMVATEMLGGMRAIQLEWKAERPGNWIFHCHYAVHVGPLVDLDARGATMDPNAHARHESAQPHHMSGLVTGLTITPKGDQPTPGPIDRYIRLEQREKPGFYGKQPGMSYVLTDSKAERDPSALPIPGPTLVLERGKRVAVNIVNASTSHAAVHWHGIELESFPDGVPGVSGAGTQLLPPIAPRESLTVAFTPPRAGSFMYHSHFSESQQVGSGLYGPIVVLDSGEHFDPETDRILFFGTAGGLRSFLDPAPTVLLNGNARPAPMQLTAGTRYRFRLFNLAGDVPTFVTLTQGDAPVSWRAVAKDGYTLPPSQAIEKPAALVFDPGEIYDFEFTPARAGTLSLRFGLPRPHPPAQGPPLVTVDVHVR